MQIFVLLSSRAHSSVCFNVKRYINPVTTLAGFPEAQREIAHKNKAVVKVGRRSLPADRIGRSLYYRASFKKKVVKC